MVEVIARVFYGPPDWIVDRFSQRDRRAFGFWTFVVSLSLYPIFGGTVFYVSALSIVALIPNFSSETPNEVETNGEH
jgi:hypothetical protein